MEINAKEKFRRKEDLLLNILGQTCTLTLACFFQWKTLYLKTEYYMLISKHSYIISKKGT